jgi:hypothetical protein
MAKKKTAVRASDPLKVAFEIDAYYVEQLIGGQIETHVKAAIDSKVDEAVGSAVAEMVEQIGRDRVSAAIDKTLNEGWPTVNSYGERVACSNRTLKDRIGEILSAKDSYSSNGRWLDTLVKNLVNDAVTKHFQKDIDAARASFKQQVDGVLSSVVKKALGEHLGVKV